MDHTSRSRFTVRSYEVDSYGHVNNGVYVNWFEQGRLDWLESLGFSYDGFAERQEWFVVGRTEVVFQVPLRGGEEVELVSRVESLGRTSVRFVQEMLRCEGGQPTDRVVSRAQTVMVFSGPGGGSTPIPDDFRTAVEGAEGAG